MYGIVLRLVKVHHRKLSTSYKTQSTCKHAESSKRLYKVTG